MAQKLGTLKGGQTPGAKKDYEEGIRGTHVSSPVHVEDSLKKLFDVHCP